MSCRLKVQIWFWASSRQDRGWRCIRVPARLHRCGTPRRIADCLCEETAMTALPSNLWTLAVRPFSETVTLPPPSRALASSPVTVMLPEKGSSRLEPDIQSAQSRMCLKGCGNCDGGGNQFDLSVVFARCIPCGLAAEYGLTAYSL